MMKAGKHSSPRRGLSGLLAAGWLCLGLEPCLVAAAEHACPHCPPEAAADGAAQHAGHAHHPGNIGTGETETAKFETGEFETGAFETAPTCATMSADCCDAAGAALASRSGGDAPDVPDGAAYAPAPAMPALRRCRPVAPSPHPPDPPARAAPLNVIHCVYLK